MAFAPQARNQGCHSIVDILRYRAEHSGQAPAYLFLSDGENLGERLTYAQLDHQAAAIADRLRSTSSAGDRGLLLFPSGLDFISAFFGCLYARVIPVALYPPDPGSKHTRRVLDRMVGIVADAEPTVALTTQAILPDIRQHLPLVPRLSGLEWLATDAVHGDGDQPAPDPGIGPETIAFLQYTSGSTSRPRGVVVTHANLLYNERMVFMGGESTPGSVCVSWLPVFHDMGLIASMLQALYAGMPCVLMTPVHFIKKPVRWLDAITRYRATYSGAPNFAYELCARKVTPEQKERLDLSSWELAYSSSEPVQAATLDRFCEAFDSVGFRRRAFYPAYGLAEATVIVSGGRKDVEPVVASFSRGALLQHRAVPGSEVDEDAVRLVSSGATLLDERIAIVDPETCRQLDDHQVGEIWVSGPNVAPGYWRAVDDTNRTFCARVQDDDRRLWLRTGDLGFLEDGELFVTGRRKDVIIVAGRNHYPQDIELTVEQCDPAIRAGCCVAFAIQYDDEEQVVVAAEVRPDGGHEHLPPDPAHLKSAIAAAVSQFHDIRLFDVCLLDPVTIPKTSSGKIRRHACRDMYSRDGLSLWPPGSVTRLAGTPRPLPGAEE